MHIRHLCAALTLSLVFTGCYPPQIQYPYTPMIQNRRMELKQNLLKLLPEDQQKMPAAQQEAQWLADTAYKAAAGISRVNGSHFPGWSGNALVNSRFQDRGLCWHYQHDMYRELRRRKLTFFRVGCCVRDRAKRTEHNCVYIAAAQSEWPNAWVLDAWKWNGRLKVNLGTELDQDEWDDFPSICRMLSVVYTEGHNFPVEYWYIIRDTDGKYSPVSDDKAINSKQYLRMIENIEKGYREHPGSPTNY